MSDCNCKNTETIPDFTKEGFSGKQGPLQTSLVTATHTVPSLHQQLADQGVLALDVSACVSASYDGSKICLTFPIIGNICFNAPINIPVGAVLKACGTVCTKWGVIPEGLKITLYLNNNPVWNGVVWGSC